MTIGLVSQKAPSVFSQLFSVKVFAIRKWMRWMNVRGGFVKILFWPEGRPQNFIWIGSKLMFPGSYSVEISINQSSKSEDILQQKKTKLAFYFTVLNYFVCDIRTEKSSGWWVDGSIEFCMIKSKSQR